MLIRKDGILRKAESKNGKETWTNGSTYYCNYQDSMQNQRWKNQLPREYHYLVKNTNITV